METQKYYDDTLNSVLSQIREVTSNKDLSDANTKEWLLEIQREINKSLDDVNESPNNFSNGF